MQPHQTSFLKYISTQRASTTHLNISCNPYPSTKHTLRCSQGGNSFTYLSPPRRCPVGTKTAKNPSGGKGRRGLGQRTPGSGILDRAVLALERMKENGKGKKERWRLYLTRRKRWGVERLKRGGGKEGSWHGEGGRATTVARDSGSSGGGGTAGGRQRGVRGSCFVWVSGCWFRRFCVPPKLIFFHSILY
jgi:hypothetical protein